MTGAARPARPAPPTTRRQANAFLFGLLFNQAQKAAQAWAAPDHLERRLGHLDPAKIAAMEESAIAAVIAAKPALHRFPRVLARHLQGSAGVLVADYQADARNLWHSRPSSRDLVARLTRFPGIGRHKAQIGVFLLALDFGLLDLDEATRAGIRTSCPRLYAQYPDKAS